MSLITANFTDVHGTHHAAAVFKVLTVNVYSNQSKTLQVDAKNEITVSDEGQLNADFRAQFWVSQEAKDSGMLPLQFSILEAGSEFERSSFEIPNIANPFELSQNELLQAAKDQLVEILNQSQEN